MEHSDKMRNTLPEKYKIKTKNQIIYFIRHYIGKTKNIP